MLVVGIDPGTATTGFGVVAETPEGYHAIAYGVILTPANQPLELRLLSLYRQLNQVLTLHRPDYGAVEKLFFSKNVTTAMAVGQARGVALLTLAELGIPMAEYNPVEVKQAVAGYGGAGKHQVQSMVKALLQLSDLPRPDDAADALAIAICHLSTYRMNTLATE